MKTRMTVRFLAVKIVAVFGVIQAHGAALVSNWIAAGSANWSLGTNWSNGIPNNNGADTYTAVIAAPSSTTITLNTIQTVISDLQFQSGRISASSGFRLTVLGSTTLSAGASARFAVNAAGTQQTIFDLGNLAAFSGGTLPAGDYAMTTTSATSTAAIQWPGADIQTVGAGAIIRLTGIGAKLRNATNNADALANLAVNQGIVDLNQRGLTLGSPFTNGGTFSINAAVEIGDTTYPDQFALTGTLTNTGSFEMNSSSTNTSFSVNGSMVNSGVMNVRFRGFSAPAVHLPVSITGNLTNSASGSLAFQTQHHPMDITVGGALFNSGTIQLTSTEQPLTLAAGSLGDLVGGETLAAGNYLLNAPTASDAVTIMAAGADIRTIGAAASIELLGANASFKNTTTGASALANLAAVNGTLTLRNQSFSTWAALTIGGVVNFFANKLPAAQTFTVNGDFANTGTLLVSAIGITGPIGGAIFSASGPLAQNTGGALTAGAYTIDAGSSTDDGPTPSTAKLAWSGAQIVSVGAAASLTLVGAGSSILNSANQADALSGLAANAGFIEFRDRNFTSSGSISNADKAVFRAVNSAFALNGSLINAGSWNVEADKRTSPTTIAGNLDNTKNFTVYAHGSSGTANASAVVTGTLVQQVANVLQGGKFAVLADSGHTATLSWTGADLQTIGPDAYFQVSGVQAAARDRGSNLDALRNISSVQGTLVLGGVNRLLVGGLSVSGELNLSNANYSVPGAVTNTGTIEFTSSAVRTLAIGGVFSNTGEISLTGNARLSSNTALVQQSGTTLTGGAFFLSGVSTQKAQADWPGAQIVTIGADAAIGISGALSGIANKTNMADALAGLAANQGGFFLQNHNVTFAGNFTNTGRFESNGTNVFTLPAANSFASNGELSVAGLTTLSGGSLSLQSLSEFEIVDFANGVDPSTLQPTYTLGSLTVNSVTLSGKLSPIVFDLVPNPATQYLIIDAQTLAGTFSNVAFGARVPVADGYSANGADVLGSFVVSFDATTQNVYLTDFLAVPEPSTALLVASGALLLNGRRRVATSIRPSSPA